MSLKSYRGDRGPKPLWKLNSMGELLVLITVQLPLFHSHSDANNKRITDDEMLLVTKSGRGWHLKELTWTADLMTCKLQCAWIVWWVWSSALVIWASVWLFCFLPFLQFSASRSHLSQFPDKTEGWWSESVWSEHVYRILYSAFSISPQRNILPRATQYFLALLKFSRVRVGIRRWLSRAVAVSHCHSPQPHLIWGNGRVGWCVKYRCTTRYHR